MSACSICAHPKRGAIDRALSRKGAPPLRTLAAQFGVSHSALSRHKRQHLLSAVYDAKTAAEKASLESVAQLVKAEHAEDIKTALDVLGQLRSTNAALIDAFERANERGDVRAICQIYGQLHKQLELQAKLKGELDGPGNVFLSPQWLQIRTALAAALTPYPEAREAVLNALIAASEPVV